jgi:hypothetical protein
MAVVLALGDGIKLRSLRRRNKTGTSSQQLTNAFDAQR